MTDSRTSDANHDQNTHSWRNWGWVVIVLPVLYVLSTGPATWIYNRNVVSPELLRAMYAPLAWLMEAVPAIEQPLMDYVSLWES